MASMKPLFTISVLLIVGVYLFKTINAGPARPHAGANSAGDQAAVGIPPLPAGAGATLAQDNNAAAWPANTPSAGSAAPALPPVVTQVDSNVPPATAPPNTATAADPPKATLPEVPPIPELPELPKTADVASATPPATPPAAATAPPIAPAAPIAPALPTTTPAPATQPEQVPPAASASAAPAAPPTAPPITPIPPAAAQSIAPVTPAPTSPSATPVDDRYGLSANAASAAAPPATATPPSAAAPPAGAPITPVPDAPTASAAAPATATFAASWPAIQAALDKNDLKLAHQLLTKWHGEETLAPADSERVEALLGQLAGTVIYSNEHRLEPPRVVKQGETLESIAKEYSVPWQLLAKINGIPAPEQVRAGQELKVVRGPFSAVVNLRRNELTLEVDGRYAGTFPVTVTPGAAVTEGLWAVDQKVAGQSNAVAPAAYTTPPATAERTIVLRSAATAQPGGPTLAITSGSPATPPSAGAVAIQVAPQDAEDLSDILSIGSRVIVRK